MIKIYLKNITKWPSLDHGSDTFICSKTHHLMFKLKKTKQTRNHPTFTYKSGITPFVRTLFLCPLCKFVYDVHTLHISRIIDNTRRMFDEYSIISSWIYAPSPLPMQLVQNPGPASEKKNVHKGVVARGNV